MHMVILGNPVMFHSVPTRGIHHICDECSEYGIDHAWVTEDGIWYADYVE